MAANRSATPQLSKPSTDPMAAEIYLPDRTGTSPSGVVLLGELEGRRCAQRSLQISAQSGREPRLLQEGRERGGVHILAVARGNEQSLAAAVVDEPRQRARQSPRGVRPRRHLGGKEGMQVVL